MKKEKEQPLKVNTTFEELMKIATKGNPKPKRKSKNKGKQMKINVKKLLVGLTPADMDNPVVKRLLAYVRDNGQG